MSLKAFHLVFILASIALSLLFGVWCFEEYSYSGEGVTLGMGIAALLSTFGLSFYLGWFLKKLKHVGFVGFVLFALASFTPTTAQACSVCIGNPDSTMVKSANAAIWFLLVVISTILVGFAGLFLYWAKKDKSYHATAA